MQKKSFKNSIVFSVVVLSILLLGSLSIIAQPGLKIPIVPPIVTDSFDFRIYTHEMDSLVSIIKSDPGYDEEEYEGSIGEYNRWLWFWRTRVAFDPVLNKFNCDKANKFISRYANQSSQVQRLTSVQTICDGSSSYPSNWTTIGPDHYADQTLGFVKSIAIDPTNTNDIYAGSENGGIYKSTNNGTNWQNITNYLRIPGLGINDISIDPINHNEIWAVTGSKSYGAGIIKSNDAGATWFIYPIIKEDITDPDIPDNFAGYLIKVDPVNTNYVWYTRGNSLYRINKTTTETKLIYTVDDGIPNPRGLVDMELIPIQSGTVTRILLGTVDANAWSGGRVND